MYVHIKGSVFILRMWTHLPFDPPTQHATNEFMWYHSLLIRSCHCQWSRKQEHSHLEQRRRGEQECVPCSGKAVRSGGQGQSTPPPAVQGGPLRVHRNHQRLHWLDGQHQGEFCRYTRVYVISVYVHTYVISVSCGGCLHSGELSSLDGCSGMCTWRMHVFCNVLLENF